MRAWVSPVVVGLLALAIAPTTAQAAWTSSVSANTVTMSGDATPIQLEIGVTGGNLSHNLAGQPGFASAQDFNSFNGAVVDTVPNSGLVTLNIDGGTASDQILIGTTGAPASAIAPAVNVNGGGGPATSFDNLSLNDFGATADRSVSVTPGPITGLGGPVGHFNLETLGVSTGSGNDVVTVAAGVPGLFAGTGGGTDRIVPAEGALVQADGGAGNDTLDFSSWTSSVTTEPPLAGHFQADLTAGQEVTPSASTATGDVFMSFDLSSGRIDFMFADVSGITPAQEAGSHIQLGAPGVQDAILYDLETGSDPDATWSANGGGMILFTNSGFFPASRLADVIAGNTFVNIRSTNAKCGPAGNQPCSDGEIRGQILSSDIGYTAKAPTGFFNGIENLVGGSAADTLAGNPLANTIDGGPGADTIRAAEGDDHLRAADGTADAAIDCGPGTDVADRDLKALDPDAIVSGCETVNTAPPPPGTISPIDAKVKRKGRRLTIKTGATAACPPFVAGDCALSASATARVKGGGKLRAKRRVTLGKLAGSVAPGASALVDIKLKRKGARRLTGAGRLKVKLAIDLAVPEGQTTALQRSQRLRAPKRRR